MNDEKEKIIDFAAQKFMNGGFFKTTMDELAAELRVSKKTIYKNFPSKEELVRTVALKILTTNAKLIEDAVKLKCNPVEKLYRIFETVGKILIKINENNIRDIHYYTPETWKEIDEFRTKKMNAFLKDIIEQGQKEGYILKRKPEIIITMFLASARAIVNPAFVINNRFTLLEALKETTEILSNGIMTEKGRKVFKKLKDGEVK
jgi:AcrR family transcriptional regulator